MDYFDIYSDLDQDLGLGDQFVTLQKKNDELAAHIASLESDIDIFSTEIKALKLTQENLTKNISELYNTAKNELQRKDRIINDLRDQLAKINTKGSFNSHQPSKPKVYIIPKKSNSQKRDEEASRFTSKDKIIVSNRSRSKSRDKVPPNRSRSKSTDRIVVSKRSRSKSREKIAPNRSRSKSRDRVAINRSRSQERRKKYTKIEHKDCKDRRGRSRDNTKQPIDPRDEKYFTMRFDHNRDDRYHNKYSNDRNRGRCYDRTKEAYNNRTRDTYQPQIDRYDCDDRSNRIFDDRRRDYEEFTRNNLNEQYNRNPYPGLKHEVEYENKHDGIATIIEAANKLDKHQYVDIEKSPKRAPDTPLLLKASLSEKNEAELIKMQRDILNSLHCDEPQEMYVKKRLHSDAATEEYIENDYKKQKYDDELEKQYYNYDIQSPNNSINSDKCLNLVVREDATKEIDSPTNNFTTNDAAALYTPRHQKSKSSYVHRKSEEGLLNKTKKQDDNITTQNDNEEVATDLRHKDKITDDAKQNVHSNFDKVVSNITETLCELEGRSEKAREVNLPNNVIDCLKMDLNLTSDLESCLGSPSPKKGAGGSQNNNSSDNSMSNSLNPGRRRRRCVVKLN